MANWYDGLEPIEFWTAFAGISSVPRPSKHEDKIRAWLTQQFQKRGCDVVQDPIGNLRIDVPATAGREQAPLVAIQGHMDMVCEKNDDTDHDFMTTGVFPYVDGEWVRAKGTTLGADNGVSMAYMFAIVDRGIAHGPLRFIITTDEETGLTGAAHLSPEMVEDVRYLLNIDSDEQGIFYVGCAGGRNTTARFSMESSSIGGKALRIKLSGLLGGHSGADIHLGRGNANKSMARALYLLGQKAKIRLSLWKGGDKHNALPREAQVVAQVQGLSVEQIRAILDPLAQALSAELGSEGGQPRFTVEEQDANDLRALGVEDSARLIAAFHGLPHGVQSMSPSMAGLVSSSNNLAAINLHDGECTVLTSQRADAESLVENVSSQVEAILTTAGAAVGRESDYPPWTPQPDSELVGRAVKVYEAIHGKDAAKVWAIHAGLETALLGSKNLNMQMVSFGADILGAHSPDERLRHRSVSDQWKLVEGLLDELSAS